jgi:hypothetical protein
MEIASCLPSDAWNFEADARFPENLCTPGWNGHTGYGKSCASLARVGTPIKGNFCASLGGVDILAIGDFFAPLARVGTPMKGNFFAPLRGMAKPVMGNFCAPLARWGH